VQRGKKGGETGIFGRCNGRKTRKCKGDYSDSPINESPTVIWEIVVSAWCNE
jgi:hypothetical protein